MPDNKNQDVKINIVVNAESAKKGYDEILAKEKQLTKESADIQKAFPEDKVLIPGGVPAIRVGAATRVAPG